MTTTILCLLCLLLPGGLTACAEEIAPGTPAAAEASTEAAAPETSPAAAEAAEDEPEEADGENGEEDEDPVMDIVTTDGKTYRDATVERVTPAGIDIGYLREDGTYAIVGIPLSKLTPELQKVFHYDPEKAKAFEAQLAQAGKKTMEETAESEAERMARVTREIKARLAGEDVQIKPADLRFAIYARRRPVAVVPVEQVQSGTVVAVIDDASGLPALPTLVLIDRLKLEAGSGRWSGFLYPTGMHARYRDIERIPVFSDSLDEAQLLLERYLDIYSEFAAESKEAEEGAESAETQPDQAGAQPDAGGGGQAGDGSGSGSDQLQSVSWYSYDYPYCIGRSYRPVVWWRRHHHHGLWNPPPRPPRPRPPEPGQKPPVTPPDTPHPPHSEHSPHLPRPIPPAPNQKPGQKPVTPPVIPHPPDSANAPRLSRPIPSESGQKPAQKPGSQPGQKPAAPPAFGAPPRKPAAGGSASRPSRPYHLEQNGGFRRVVPKATPARPATTPGTAVRPQSPRVTPVRPATWKGTPAPARPVVPSRSGGTPGRIGGF